MRSGAQIMTAGHSRSIASSTQHTFQLRPTAVSAACESTYET